ncbi:RNase MRP subunit [Neophaeococcomyces mojaviensis]|uniref:RNase MRP subunit n=1 Tax=Neophaeococcomyces mojaviensis TaxID=3383035 RepID=A0ACC2ZT60_9EURO|nr:RNase MRP subunit [Knufia sp. JES_112]
MSSMKRAGKDPNGSVDHTNKAQARKTGSSVSTHKKKSKGLNRPQKPISFQITTESPSSAISATTTQVHNLQKRLHLLTLIFRRNKNQHRSQLFFKHLCLLRASLTRLLKVHTSLATLSTTGSLGSSADQIRQRFEREAALRSQREILEEHLRESLVPQCYVSFSGLVADSQFANLGVVLVSLLAEIAAGEDGVGLMKDDAEAEPNLENVGPPSVVQAGTDERPVKWGGLLMGRSTKVTGEDQGEVVDRVYDTDGGEAETEQMPVVEREGEFGGFSDDFDVQPQTRLAVAVSQSVMSRDSDVDLANMNISKTATPPRQENTDDVTSKKRKKKKKGQNALDDLFKGLI